MLYNIRAKCGKNIEEQFNNVLLCFGFVFPEKVRIKSVIFADGMEYGSEVGI